MVKSIITVTTDLGDDFCSMPLQLEARLMKQTNKRRTEITSKRVSWPAGARSLALFLEVKSFPLDGDVILHLSSLSDETEHLQMDNMPELVGIWSDNLSSIQSKTHSHHLVKRELALGGDIPQLLICEETGESIARHIWCVNSCWSLCPCLILLGMPVLVLSRS